MVFKHLVHKTNSERLSGNIQGARPLWPACPPPQATRDDTVHCWTARYPARRDTTTRPVEPLSLPQKLAVSPPSPRYFYLLRHQPAKLIPRTSITVLPFCFHAHRSKSVPTSPARNATTSTCPALLAAISGVSPAWLLLSRSAQPSSSSAMAQRCPPRAARMAGVSPSLVAWSGSA